MPSLSIHLLCWNHARYLEEAIGSVAAQTSDDFELVFLDNASADGSAELARRLLAEANIRHVLLVNEEPASIAVNVNRMFAHSAAPLATSLSTDDWFAPRYVEAMLAASREHPAAGLLYPGGFVYYEDSGRLEPVPTDKHLSGDLSLPLLRREDPMFFVGTCVRREAFDAVGGFDEQLQIEDLDFFVRIARRFPIQRVDEQLVYYRRSGTAISSNIPWMVQGWEQFYRKHKDSGGVDMDWWMAETYRNYAATAIDQRSWKLAAELLAKAVMHRPLAPRTWQTSLYLARSFGADAMKRLAPSR